MAQTTLRYRLQTASVISFSVGILLLWRYFLYSIVQLMAVVITLLLFLFSAILYDLSLRMPKQHCYPFLLLLQMYLFNTWIYIVGLFAFRRFEKQTQHYNEIQDNFLLSLLKSNSQTVYGRDHKFWSLTDREKFRKEIPLAKYTDIQPYIVRVAKGEKNILTAEEPHAMVVTSGTTGFGASMFCINQSMVNGFTWIYYPLSTYTLKMYQPKLREVRKFLWLFWTHEFDTTEGGLSVTMLSASKPSKFMSDMQTLMHNSPAAVLSIKHEPTILYMHLLFGIQDRNIGNIFAAFSGTVYMSMKILESSWREMVDSIESGYISTNASKYIDAKTRYELEQHLPADPERARELRTEFEKGFEGIACRIWPHCAAVLCGDSGSMKIYSDLIQQEHCKGLSIYSQSYASTEGICAVNIWPLSEKREYLPLPNFLFCEFIPEANIDDPNPKTLFADETEVGGVYELVVTTVSGQYRHRMGDVIRISRFHNGCPALEYHYRTGEAINLFGEKLPEPTLRKTLFESFNNWPHLKLIDYTCANSLLVDKCRGKTSEMMHYVLFLELEGPADQLILSDEQTTLIHDNLLKIFLPYSMLTQNKVMDQLEVIQLDTGCFDEFRQYYVTDRKGSFNQMKIPRFLKRDDDVQFFLSRRAM